MKQRQEELIQKIKELKRFREPHARKKALILSQLKEVNKRVRKYDKMILVTSNELAELTE